MKSLLKFFGYKIFGVGIWIWLSALLAIALLVLLIVIITKIKNKGVVIVDDIDDTNQSRKTKHEISSPSSEDIIKINDAFILERGKKYSIGINGDLTPGKYLMIINEKDAITFNLQQNGFIKEHENNSTIILNEGETIISLTNSISLKEEK